MNGYCTATTAAGYEGVGVVAVLRGQLTAVYAKDDGCKDRSRVISTATFLGVMCTAVVQ